MATDEKKKFRFFAGEALTRRTLLAASAVTGATLLLPDALAAPPTGKRTFTILHTNDLHSSLIGMGPSSDYTPFTLGDDKTRGGWARLAAAIARRRTARQAEGPVLTLDAGDFSMGTPFGAASREIGAELRLLARMGFDATTFGNHEFDLGPDGLAQAIGVAAKAGRIPVVLSSNTDLTASDPRLAGLQRLAKEGVLRRHAIIERGGLRFGLIGLLGAEASHYTGGTKFTDAIKTATELVHVLREQEKVDVVICLSHGGVMKGKDGRYTDGDDVRVAREVPGIDVVIGGHSHTELTEAIVVDGRPVVQTGKESANLGELVLRLEGGKVRVQSYRLHPMDDTVAGDHATAEEIEKLKKGVTATVFASRGYSVDQPLAVVPQDLSNKFTDIAAGTVLANLVTDAFRAATGADVGFTANGLMRAPLTRGKSGVQTVYDVFAVAPLGAGVVDDTAGSALVTGWFTGKELKHILEFLLVDNPTHPGEMFPRTSGLRYRYDASRPKFDVVTAIELGDLDRGYRAIDITGQGRQLYSLTTPLYLALVVVAIPKYSKGLLPLVPKNKEGKPLASRVEALDVPQGPQTPYLLPPEGTVDKGSIAAGAGKNGVREIKEWQAIMDHLRKLPVKEPGKLPIVPVDGRAAEVRAIKVG
jgi:5'-nucleotidase/UDP-sugar diphosphatase